MTRGMVVLLVDSEEHVVEAVREVVAPIQGCRLATVEQMDAAVGRFREGLADLLLIYLRTPSDVRDADRLLQQARAARQAVPVIFLCEVDDPDARLALIRRGAVDCLCRPLNLSRLALLMELFAARAQVRSARLPYNPRPAEGTRVGEFLFESVAMRRLLVQVQAVAPLETTVLLTGETGTGKTHLARAIHDLSPRRTKQFMVVDCGTLTPTLLESELFGHVRGAFTHADRDRQGRLAAVEDGTLLLDEIDCVPLECQARLLRAVEDRTFVPIGSTASQPLRARLIVASNRRLEDEVAAGRFRSDLYYRLNVVSFSLPPLRDRKETIPSLVEKYVGEFSQRNGAAVDGLALAAMDAMAAYHWPGNIRELRNVIERAVAFSAGRRIEVDDLPEAIQRANGYHPPAAEPAPALRDNRLALARNSAEMSQLREALHRNDNNRTCAAAELGVSRVTLYKKLRRYGLM